MELSAKGVAFIENAEGCKFSAYLDQRGVWSLGYGHTLGVKMGDTCTQEQADQWLSEDSLAAQNAVNTLVTVPLDQNQFDALVSFTFNVGVGSFKGSTLLSLLNQKAYAGAAQQFLKWNHVNGVENAGLTKRRQAEQAMFVGGA